MVKKIGGGSLGPRAWWLGLLVLTLACGLSVIFFYIVTPDLDKVPQNFDIKGKWSGDIFIKEVISGQECLYNGSVELGLSRDDKLVYGVFFVDGIIVEEVSGNSKPSSACPVPSNPPSLTFEVNGTLSLPSLKLMSGSLGLLGYVSGNDSLVLRPDSCVINYKNPGCRMPSLGPGETRFHRVS